LGEGGADRIIRKPVPAEASRSAPASQALRCAGCGAAGHAPTIVYDKAAAPGVPLTPVFGWHEDGRPALLCPACKRRLQKNRGRARYSKAKPTDGRMTP
jgi:hypothetical protein